MGIVKLPLSTFALTLVACVGVYLLRLQGINQIAWLNGEYAIGLAIAMLAQFRCLDPLFGVRRSYEGHYELKPCSSSLVWLCRIALVSSMDSIALVGSEGEATELVWVAMLQYAALCNPPLQGTLATSGFRFC